MASSVFPSIAKKEALGCPFIAMLLYKDIHYSSILFDCSPKIEALTIDRNEYYVHIPRITAGSLPVLYLVSE